MTKTKVAVLRGGPSSEYEVSLQSGAAVLDALHPERYDAVDVFIDKNGRFHVGGFEKTLPKALIGVDVVFNALHGAYGEDGKVQKALEDIGIRYTGSRSLAAAIAMNKDLTKKALEKKGMRMPYHRIFKKGDKIFETPREIFKIISCPSVVKPVASGSSVGVSIVKDFDALPQALEKAFAESDTVMIEEYVDGREVSCAILENFRGQKTYALPPIEIVPPENKDFFDYEAKYGGNSREICPSNFSPEIKKEIERMAAVAHEVLGLSHYSRSDFIVHPKRGVYFLEINTLPGLTKESLLPKEARAVGVEFPELVEHLVTIARSKK